MSCAKNPYGGRGIGSASIVSGMNSRCRIHSRWHRIALLLMLGTGAAFAASGEAAPAMRYTLPPASLALTLERFGEQSGLQILYPPELIAGLHSDGLDDVLLPLQALQTLLQGSLVQAEFVSKDTVMLRALTQESRAREKQR